MNPYLSVQGGNVGRPTAAFIKKGVFMSFSESNNENIV